MEKLFVDAAGKERTISRQRWLIGVLSVMLIIAVAVVGGLAYLSPYWHAVPKQAAAEAAPAPVALPPPPPTVELVVARHRIESGTALDDSMFVTAELPEKLVPPGAIRAADRHKLAGLYSAALIPTHSVITDDFTISSKNDTPFDIPPGYRAATIVVDYRTGVEGFARPNTRVDVIWTYKENNNLDRVLTIVRGAKVLSISGITEVEGAAPLAKNRGSTATLLVPTREAKLLELAQSTGIVSLMLIGDRETEIGSPPNEELITINDLLKVSSEEKVEEVKKSSGVCLVQGRIGQPAKTFILDAKGWSSKVPDEPVKGGAVKVQSTPIYFDSDDPVSASTYQRAQF